MTSIRHIVFIFLIIFLAIGFQINGQVSPQWSTSFTVNNPKTVWLNASAVDKDGNVYEVGYLNEVNNPTTVILNKYNSSGILEWTQYNGGLYENNNLILDDSGNVFVLGSTSTFIWIIKYDNSGVIKWTKTYSTLQFSNNVVFDVATDDSLSLYVLGWTQGQSTILKYDSNGILIWSALGSTNAPYGNWGISIDKNHSVYITTQETNPNFTCNIYKYSIEGIKLWNKMYKGNFVNGEAGPVDIVTDKYANIYVLAWTKSIGVYDYNAAILKYDSSGNLKWTSIYDDGTDYITPKQFALDNDQNVYAVAELRSPTGYSTYGLIKVDSTGIRKWTRTYNSNILSDTPNGLAIDLNGFIYVTGESRDSLSNVNFLTIKYDFNGNRIWVDRYQTAQFSNDRGRYVNVDSAGNVYVSGTTAINASNGNFTGITTLKYSLPINVEENNSNHTKEVTLFPNPFRDKLYLNFSEEIKDASLEIYDVMGRCVHATYNINEKKSIIQIKNLECGIYFYSVMEKNTVLHTGKIIAQ